MASRLRLIAVAYGRGAESPMNTYVLWSLWFSFWFPQPQKVAVEHSVILVDFKARRRA